MTFKRKLAEKVIAGEKTVTRRLVSDNPKSPYWRKKCGYRVGQEIAICPGRGKHQIGKARVVDVRKQLLLSVIEPGEAQAEGFEDLAAFREAWTQINGSFETHAIVWRIELEVQP